MVDAHSTPKKKKIYCFLSNYAVFAEIVSITMFNFTYTQISWTCQCNGHEHENRMQFSIFNPQRREKKKLHAEAESKNVLSHCFVLENRSIPVVCIRYGINGKKVVIAQHSHASILRGYRNGHSKFTKIDSSFDCKY